MDKSSLLAICRKSLGSMASSAALEKAIGILDSEEPLKIERGATSRSVEHYRLIYRRRLSHCRSLGRIPLGLADALHAFESLPDGKQLAGLAVESATGEVLFFWIGGEGNVVACIVFDSPEGLGP